MPINHSLVVQVVQDVTIVTFTNSSLIDTQQIEAIRDKLFNMVE